MTTEIEVLFEEAPGRHPHEGAPDRHHRPELRDFFLTVAWPGGFDRIVAFFQR